MTGRRFLILSALSLTVLAPACGSDEKKSSSSARATKADAKRWAADWWVWVSKRDKGQDPVTDKTGERCTQDQPDDVFFLAGTYGGKATRTCTAPSGRPVFLPVLNRLCDAKDKAACTREAKDGAKYTLEVDGKDRKQDVEYVESVTIAADPDQVAVGYHAALDDLDAGKHEIHFTGHDASGFSVDVTYRLTVGKS